MLMHCFPAATPVLSPSYALLARPREEVVKNKSCPLLLLSRYNTHTVPQNWHTQSHESHDHRAQKSITLSLTLNNGKPNRKTNQTIMVLKMIQDARHWNTSKWLYCILSTMQVFSSHKYNFKSTLERIIP